MTFLNATLIFGMAAAAVPLVLHLLARRQPRQVMFPSVRFLTRRFESNRTRLQVRRWWLLALRIAALVTLALALARPAIHHSLSLTWLTIGLVVAFSVALLVMASRLLVRGQSRATGYSLAIAAALILLVAGGWGAATKWTGPLPVADNLEPVAIAIVLDNSATSAWKATGDDRIGRMRELANWMVTRLPRTSRIAIVDRSWQVTSFSLDAATAMARIEQLRPLEATQPIAARLEAAMRLVRSSELPNRQVLLVTDLAVSTWDDAAVQSGLAGLLAEDPPVALTVFDLGEFAGTNRSLSLPRFADTTPPRGVPVAVSVALELAAGTDSSSVSATVDLELFSSDPSLPIVRDGVVARPQARSVDRTTARLSGGGSSELLLTIPALDVGTHHGRIRLAGEDPLPLDDNRYFTLQVLEPSSILLVGDDEDETRIISLAITAAPGLINELDAEFAVERIQSADLGAARPGDFNALILLDPPASLLAEPALVQYAQGGGGVLVCLGPAAGQGPVESALVPNLVRRWRVPQPGTFLQVSSSAHPITETLAAETPWSDFRVWQYWQVGPAETDGVLMQFAGTTHAAVIERTVPGSGSPGRVIVINTPLPALSGQTRAWNDLFGTDPWPAWLLLRQSVEYAARRGGGELTSLVGTPQVISLQPDPNPAADQPRRIQLFAPGDTAPVPLDVPPQATQLTIADTPRSGTYWLRGADPGAGFSVNLPPAAIQLQRIGQPQLDQIFSPDRYLLVRDREGIEFAQNKATQRVSLQSPAILLALVIFLLEQVLGNRFYRAKLAATA